MSIRKIFTHIHTYIYRRGIWATSQVDFQEPKPVYPLLVRCGPNHTGVICKSRREAEETSNALWTFGNGWYGRCGGVSRAARCQAGSWRQPLAVPWRLGPVSYANRPTKASRCTWNPRFAAVSSRLWPDFLGRLRFFPVRVKSKALKDVSLGTDHCAAVAWPRPVLYTHSISIYIYTVRYIHMSCLYCITLTHTLYLRSFCPTSLCLAMTYSCKQRIGKILAGALDIGV